MSGPWEQPNRPAAAQAQRFRAAVVLVVLATLVLAVVVTAVFLIQRDGGRVGGTASSAGGAATAESATGPAQLSAAPTGQSAVGQPNAPGLEQPTTVQMTSRTIGPRSSPLAQTEPAAAFRVDDCLKVAGGNGQSGNGQSGNGQSGNGQSGNGQSGNGQSDNLEVSACGARAATYRVQEIGDPDGCDEYELTFSPPDDPDSSLCLAYNVAEGDCLTLGLLVRQPDAKVDCDDVSGDPDSYQVLLVDDTTSDESLCPSDSILAIPNITRGTLLCLGQA